jgi:hypothetical protein
MTSSTVPHFGYDYDYDYDGCEYVSDYGCAYFSDWDSDWGLPNNVEYPLSNNIVFGSEANLIDFEFDWNTLGFPLSTPPTCGPATSLASTAQPILLAATQPGEPNKAPSRKRERQLAGYTGEPNKAPSRKRERLLVDDNSDIKGATFKTLLSFLVSESEERVSHVKKHEALQRIEALAGPFMPVQILKVQNAGIRALSHLLSSYTGRDVSFETARLCFKKKKYNGCNCATAVLHQVLGGLTWPPMPAGDRSPIL